MKLYCDDKSASNITYNSIQYNYTYIAIYWHFINEKHNNGLIQTLLISHIWLTYWHSHQIIIWGIFFKIFHSCLEWMTFIFLFDGECETLHGFGYLGQTNCDFRLFSFFHCDFINLWDSYCVFIHPWSI